MAYRPPELLIPTHVALEMNAARIPVSQRGRVAGVVANAGEAADISKAFGARTMPTKPIIVYGPHGETILVCGRGVTEAAELQDLALEAIERHRERGPFNFAEARAREGLPEKFGEALAEHVEQRIQHHKRNRRTDPPKQLDKPEKRYW